MKEMFEGASRKNFFVVVERREGCWIVTRLKNVYDYFDTP